jgi:Cu/Ag efflux protein CusF
MKHILLTAALLVPAFVLAQPKGAIVTDQVEAVVTVTKVDAKARTVTVRGPRGNLATLDVPKEAQNLDKVKPGDRFKITYAEAAIVALTRGGEPAAVVEESVQVAPKGGTPGGYKVRTVKVSAVVDAIDYKNRYVSLRGPKGNTLALPVSDDVKDLESVKVGDKLSIAYTQALALQMVPQEKPAAKPAAKKKSEKSG